MATSIASPANFAHHAQSAASSIPGKDRRRSWLWWFLAIVAASQLYFVRELVAAFALFSIGFAAIAFVVVSLYMLHHCCTLAMARLADLRHPVMPISAVPGDSQKPA